MINPASTDYQLPERLTHGQMEIQQFSVIDSTNAEAMRQLQTGRKGSFLLLAHTQTAGKGRRGKVWQSPPGAGIYMTLVRPFPHTTRELQALSLITALSVHEALQTYQIPDFQLKWPNDLLVGKRKLGGILLEMRQSNDASYVLFGIGLNLKLPDATRGEIDQPAIDLNSLLQSTPDKSLIVAQLIESLFKNLEEFGNTSFDSFQARWNALDCFIGQKIESHIGSQRKIGKSMGVDATGALILKTEAGIEKIGGGEIFPSIFRANENDCTELELK